MKRHLFLLLYVGKGLNSNQIVRMGYYLIFNINVIFNLKRKLEINTYHNPTIKLTKL